MTTETIHTCSYSCQRIECIRAQRDELASRMTTETSNARGEVVAVPREVIDFLMGEGELQGAWFGETPTGERGQWFWRKHLRRVLCAAPPPAAARGDVRGLVAVPEGLCGPVTGARFGHHADPAIDFCVEVESLIAREFNARHGIGKPGHAPEPMWQVKAAIERAMQFRVGGDEGAKAAKASLRTLEAALAAEGVQAGAPLYAAARKLRDSARRMDDGSRWVPGTVFKQFTKALAQEHGNGQG